MVSLFLAATPPPASRFVMFFVNLSSTLSWVTRGFTLSSYHNNFSNKTVLFQKHPSICVLKKIAPQKVFGWFPVKYQWRSSFYVHLLTFLLVFQKAVQSSYSAINLSLKLAVSIKGIWKNYVSSALRVHRKLSQPATGWIT